MSKISQPLPRHYKLNSLMEDIERGRIKLPKFQRDFVWVIKKTAQLLDSILKGYPIGTFIIWKTRERLSSIKNIGSMNFPEPPTGDAIQYVLDGQQRLASLLVLIRGATVAIDKGPPEKIVDYKEVHLDLDKDPNGSEPIVTHEKVSQNSISIYDLLTANNRRRQELFPDNFDDLVDKIEDYKSRIDRYDFPVIEINDYPFDKAVDVFTRINTTGKALTLFEIMVAKTYDEKKSFDLYEKYQEFSKELEDSNSNYEIEDITVLQCISMVLKGEYSRNVILNLDKNEFIQAWDETINSIKKAIDYFRSDMRIPVSRLIPYTAFMVLFTLFFHELGKNKPTPIQKKYLEEYFWHSSLSHRFSAAIETKLARDYKIVIKKILENTEPQYGKGDEANAGAEYIRDYQFGTGDSYCKAILCLLCQLGPKSFRDNSPVILDNSWLIQANSKNYHHFFPKSYLKKQGCNDEKQNAISNITIVDAQLNKREIKAKSPSEYMKNFQGVNSDLNSTMETHLIGDLGGFGIWDNDYEKFLDERSERISQELRNRLPNYSSN